MMRKKKKELPTIENILITDAASEGKSLTRLTQPLGNLPENYVIFVENAIPGDVVDLKILNKKKNFAEAKAIKFHHFSDKRAQPFCSHFGTCGGCKWQFMQYTFQLHYKQKQVEDHLARIGKFEMPTLMPIISATEDRFYRNKLEFSFSNKRWLDLNDLERQNNGVEIESSEMNALGFHIPGRFDKVLDIEKCYLQPELSNQIRNEIKSYALTNKLSFYDIKNQQGFLRTIIVRNTINNEWMLVVNFGYEDIDQRIKLLDHISQNFPQITSLQYVINQKRNDTITDQNVILYKGDSFITEKMNDLEFRIGPKSFFQTNTIQAIKLYDLVADFANLQGNEIVYDLYTGTGTIANYVARKAKKVVGVEYVPEAIEDARINSSINNIHNTIFFAGDMKDTLNENFIKDNGQPDTIITDPPRAGMHQDVVHKLIEIAADKIVYVSCNSATQARDVAILDVLYKVEKIQPVDMFPHTHHVENIMLLKKR